MFSAHDRLHVVELDGSPVLPSAVFAAADGQVVVGREAERLARLEPARFEPNPIKAFQVLTNLETAIKDMVEAAKAYIGVLHQIMDTVTKIPQKGVGELTAKRAEIEEQGKKIATDVGDLDTRVRSRIGHK